MATNFDSADIRRTWRIYRKPGEVAEVRILNAGKWLGTVSGYFDNEDSFTKIVSELAADPDHPVPAIYFTINPVSPDLLARAANRTIAKAKNTTSDADIVALHWLPGDLDSKRPAGISSTDEEHDAAIAKAYEVRKRLIEDLGWPENAFVLADSGNGAHLDTKINLQNVPEDVALVKRCLEAMDFLFSDETIHVDTTSQNPARIWKVRGTMARKGDSIQERPHRLSRFLEVPETLETVTREQLEALAAMLPAPEKISQPSQSIGGPGFDVVAYCQAHNLSVHHTKSWTDPSGTKCTVAVLDQCIFNPDHHLSAVIIGWPNGARSYRCRHNSCLRKRWKDAKAIIEPGADSFDCIPTMDLTRARADAIEAATGVHIFNAADDPSQNEISEEELNAYSLPAGPKFECNLPKDHFIQRFMAYGSDISDAYIEYWFAAGLFALAVIADKKVKVALKQGTIYPNLYISINGKSSLARKSTVVDKAEAMLCQVKPSLLPAMVPTEFSPEAFTEHMSDYNHATWVRDEAAGVLSLMKKDYMRGFKDSLMQLYDSKPFYRKLRTSQRKGAKTEFRVDDPYLNLLWATTDASLGANTEQNDTLSGFMARFLFFFPQGNKTKWLPLEEGTTANSIFEGVVKEQLAEIAAQLKELQECQAMHFSPEAASYYTEWQRIREQEWTASNDGNAMQIYARLAPTVTKLAMLFELGMPGFDPSRQIRVEFIEEACDLVDSYFMPTARAVYDLVGANAEKNVIDRIIAYLKKHNGKATRKEILRDVKIKSTDFGEFIATMIESGQVETKTVKRGGKGRDSVYVVLLDPAEVGNVANVAKIAKIAKVEEIRSNSETEGKKSTLATLATKATFPTKATQPQKPDSSAAKGDPGFQKFKGRMKKRTCCLCGRTFPYDLTYHANGDKSGYECTTCLMHGPPPEPEKANPQTKLEASG